MNVELYKAVKSYYNFKGHEVRTYWVERRKHIKEIQVEEGAKEDQGNMVEGRDWRSERIGNQDLEKKDT